MTEIKRLLWWCSIQQWSSLCVLCCKSSRPLFFCNGVLLLLSKKAQAHSQSGCGMFLFSWRKFPVKKTSFLLKLQYMYGASKVNKESCSIITISILTKIIIIMIPAISEQPYLFVWFFFYYYYFINSLYPVPFTYMLCLATQLSNKSWQTGSFEMISWLRDQ